MYDSPTTNTNWWLYEYQKLATRVRWLIDHGKSEQAVNTINDLTHRWSTKCQLETVAVFAGMSPEAFATAAQSTNLPMMNTSTLPVVSDTLNFARNYAGIDGAHHKDWVIDQMVRLLAGAGYQDFVTKARYGDNGPHTYEWNEGIPP